MLRIEGSLLCIATAGMLALAGSCSSPGFDFAAADPIVRAALQESVVAYDAGEYKRSQKLAENALTETLDVRLLQEALYRAGRARMAREHYRKAYRNYESLLQDYPYCDQLLLVEDDVYAIGLRYIHRKPWRVFGDLFSGRAFGVEVLRQYAVSYSSSERADDAVFEIAQYHEGRREYELAAAKYEMIRDLHPGSEWFDLSLYRIGACYFLATRGAGYDDTLLLQARKDLRAYLARGLEGFRIEAGETLSRVEEELALAQLEIANLYRIRYQDRGFRMHLANAVLAYPETEAAAEAREILADHGWDVSVHSLDTLGAAGLRESSR